MKLPDKHKSLSGFVESLVARKALSEVSGQRLMAAVAATDHAFDTVVVELGLMREDMLAKALAEYLQTDFVEGPVQNADRESAIRFGLDFLKARGVVPLAQDQADELSLAVADPFDRHARDMLAYMTGRPVRVRTATRSAISSWAAALAQEIQGPVESEIGGTGAASEGDLERLRDLAQQAPVVRLVSRVVQQAFDEKATDIHIEPYELEVRLRTRVDGVLKVAEIVPAGLLPGIVTRIKMLSGLDISERRLPQDGRLRLAIRGQEVDMRVSTIPTIHGETVVLRLLDQSTVALDLPSLGFDMAASANLEKLTRQPNGIVLITGPTGSGKTTTLYALIAILNETGVKIITVEDPVEYRIHGITQLQVNTATGLTFARALRSVLRQNPNIILVGEIRDRETAEIAVQAALTGHLVLSTLHTNSAASAITRLRDMGIEDYLIGATVRGVAAQRLLRRLCSCGNSVRPACSKCGGTGYHGRTATFEIAEITEPLARGISAGMSEDVIATALMKNGMVPLEDHARALIKANATTEEEVARVVQLDGHSPP